MQYEDIIHRLQSVCMQFDNQRSEDNINLYIAGSAALILHKVLERATTDIDTFLNKNESIEKIINQYDINSNVMAYEDCFASDFEQRAKLLFYSECVKVYILSLEDIVVSKLASNREGHDDKDIMTEEIYSHIDIDLIKKLSANIIENAITNQTAVVLQYNLKKFIEGYTEYTKQLAERKNDREYDDWDWYEH